jgi:hypothetical protein
MPSGFRSLTRQVEKRLGDALKRLKAQGNETATQIEGSINRLRGSRAEDRSNATQPRQAQDDDGGSDKPALTAETQEAETPEREVHRQWWQTVVNTKLPTDQPPPKLYWKNNIRVPLPWPGTWLTVWRNEDAEGVCGVAVSGRGNAVDEIWRHLQISTTELQASLPPGSTVKPGRFGIGVTKPNDEFKNDDERRAWMQRTMLAYLAALSPRLK